LGSTQPKQVNVRVLAASNTSLKDLAAAGSFRSDLFYRLSVINIDLPPLRERPGDVDLLSWHFLLKATDKARPALRMSREVSDALRNYTFPGNVRELENAMRRAVAVCTGGIITLDCLPPEISLTASAAPRGGDVERALVADRPTMDELQRRYLQFILDENGGNRRRAAGVLGLDRRTVQRLIARHQLRAGADSETEVDGEAASTDEPGDCLKEAES
jgi:DNA-binding NtrC family response regulator